MILLGSETGKFGDRILIIYGRVKSQESEKLRTDLSLGLLKQSHAGLSIMFEYE